MICPYCKECNVPKLPIGEGKENKCSECNEYILPENNRTTELI